MSCCVGQNIWIWVTWTWIRRGNQVFCSVHRTEWGYFFFNGKQLCWNFMAAKRTAGPKKYRMHYALLWVFPILYKPQFIYVCWLNSYSVIRSEVISHSVVIAKLPSNPFRTTDGITWKQYLSDIILCYLKLFLYTGVAENNMSSWCLLIRNWINAFISWMLTHCLLIY